MQRKHDKQGTGIELNEEIKRKIAWRMKKHGLRKTNRIAHYTEGQRQSLQADLGNEEELALGVVV